VNPRSDGAENVKLVRSTTKSNAANGNWVYVGLTPNDRNDPPRYATDRVGTGLFVLEYAGKKPAAATKTN
jgi:hypothetical protein